MKEVKYRLSPEQLATIMRCRQHFYNIGEYNIICLFDVHLASEYVHALPALNGKDFSTAQMKALQLVKERPSIGSDDAIILRSIVRMMEEENEQGFILAFADIFEKFADMIE